MVYIHHTTRCPKPGTLQFFNIKPSPLKKLKFPAAKFTTAETCWNKFKRIGSM